MNHILEVDTTSSDFQTAQTSHFDLMRFSTTTHCASIEQFETAQPAYTASVVDSCNALDGDVVESSACLHLQPEELPPMLDDPFHDDWPHWTFAARDS